MHLYLQCLHNIYPISASSMSRSSGLYRQKCYFIHHDRSFYTPSERQLLEAAHPATSKQASSTGQPSPSSVAAPLYFHFLSVFNHAAFPFLNRNPQWHTLLLPRCKNSHHISRIHSPNSCNCLAAKLLVYPSEQTTMTLRSNRSAIGSQFSLLDDCTLKLTF